ncbi:MAG: DUF2161 family putative PD-(D/E)XK-type phosphodiesterase [Clostridia bacterium]|nr:hypothetical protein [Bacillota bacterium]MBO2521283.1 hypothetical protein [Bacillota bacterium]
MGKVREERLRESRLYQPVKEFWAAQGYTVRGEVEGCDLVACRGEDVVVVELKGSMNLSLILQGLNRKAITDRVYLAVPTPKGRRRTHWDRVVRLCRTLGLGLLFVSLGREGRGWVQVACEPGTPRSPAVRKRSSRRSRVLAEFETRSGDFNVGGSAGRPLVTAYREEALRIAGFLAARGPSAVREIRAACASARAGSILQRNYYGWFERLSRGVYGLTDAGRAALETYRDVVEALGLGDEAISSSSRSTPASTSS